MPVTYVRSLFNTWEQLAEGIGDTSRELVTPLGIGVPIVKFACKLWNQFPDYFTQEFAGFAFTRGLMNSVCPNVPPPPSPDFLGGQCNFYYTIETFYTYLDNQGEVKENVAYGSGILGPISGVRNNGNQLLVDAAGANPSYPEIFPGSYRYGEPRVPKVISVRLARVIPQGNNVDNCGNPPPKYPVNNPPPEGIGDTITIDNGDNTTFDVDINWKPTLDVNLQPTIVLVGIGMLFDVGGIKFELDLGGLHIYNPQFEVTFEGDKIIREPSPTLPDGQPHPYPSPKPPPPTVNNPEEESEELEEEETEESEEEDKEEDKEIVFLILELTHIPSKVNATFGATLDDTIYYAGWFCFTLSNDSGRYNFPLQYVRSRRTIYRPPEGANGFRYTLTKGAKGFARYYTHKLEET